MAIKKIIICMTSIFLILLFLPFSAFAASITPSYSLNYATPSAGNWNSLNPTGWGIYHQGSAEFLYTAYTSPSDWWQWKCDYSASNLVIGQDHYYTTTNTIEEYLKGYINGQWTVYALKLSTTCTVVYTIPFDVGIYNFKAYWQDNSGSWTQMGPANGWDVVTIWAQPVSVSLEFSRVRIDGNYQTKVSVNSPSFNTGDYHNFGAGSYFSTPIVEQTFCKADSYGNYILDFSGSRNNEVLNYG